jgi:hypothetical protein
MRAWLAQLVLPLQLAQPIPPAAPVPALALPSAASVAPAYGIAALETLGVNGLIFSYNVARGVDWAQVSAGSIQRNITDGWVWDDDDFSTNQLFHPYHGAYDFTAARTAGVSFWPATLYPLAGSLLWEIALETERPALNDQIMTTIGGSMLGEVLFHLSSRLVRVGGAHPSPWHELGAAALVPMHGLNRLAFGDRFKGVAYFQGGPWWGSLSLGLGSDTGTTGTDRMVATLDLQATRGMPGLGGWRFDQPFDYYDVQVTALAAPQVFAALILRGDLWGRKLDLGGYHGFWGFFGGYDYLTPKDAFRVSTASLGIGSVGQVAFSDDVALQTAVVVSSTFGSAGVTPIEGQFKDYHRGFGSQGVLDLRIIDGDAAMLRLSLREYVLGGVVDVGGWEDVAYLSGSFLVRVFGRSALGIDTVLAHRTSRYRDGPNATQNLAFVQLAYTVLSEPGFGRIAPDAP